jgi:hypothetical protein
MLEQTPPWATGDLQGLGNTETSDSIGHQKQQLVNGTYGLRQSNLLLPLQEWWVAYTVSSYCRRAIARYELHGPLHCLTTLVDASSAISANNSLPLDCVTCGNVSSNRHFWAHCGTVYRIHNQNINCISNFFLFWRDSRQWAKVFLFLRFLYHTQLHTTLGRTPLASDQPWYLTTHNTNNRQTSMSPMRFEPTISGDERPQTYALDCAATGTEAFPLGRLIFKVV